MYSVLVAMVGDSFITLLSLSVVVLFVSALLCFLRPHDVRRQAFMFRLHPFISVFDRYALISQMAERPIKCMPEV